MEPMYYATGQTREGVPPVKSDEPRVETSQVHAPKQEASDEQHSSDSTSAPQPATTIAKTVPAAAHAPTSGPAKQQHIRVSQAEMAAQAVSPSKRKIPQGGESSHAGSPAAAEGGSSTLTKRPKPEEAPSKALPLKYEFCAVEDMVVLISHMLGELIETNDALALRSGHLTRFHSRTAPGISVRDYLNRLAKHATLTPPLMLSMVYYIDRLCAMYPEFTINTLTVHRFLITAATVAAKGLSDTFWNNSTYARVGGVRLAELRMLELEFLYRVDWKIIPNAEVLVAYYRGLVERCPGYKLQEEREPEEEEEEEDTSDIDDEELLEEPEASGSVESRNGSDSYQNGNKAATVTKDESQPDHEGSR